MATTTDNVLPPEEALSEAPLGGTPAGRAANAALRALSKAARAFALYDARNEAIRRFLGEYRDRTNETLASFGALRLDIRQFEICLGSEVVHCEKDREKSLAFRLFRDGVRRVEIVPGVPWEELLKLLEILSVRFVGVRQQEEDVVTLLSRANFSRVKFEATAGFVARDEDEDGEHVADDDLVIRRAEGVADTAAFDHPLPELLPETAVVPLLPPPAVIAALRAEVGADHVAARAVDMVRQVLRDTSPQEAAALLPVMGEVRDYLVAEHRLAQLCELARTAVALAQQVPDAGATVLAPLARPAAIAKLLEGVPAEATAPPAELVDLLGQLADAPLEPLLDALDAALSGTEGARPLPVLRPLVAQAARPRPQALLERLAVASPATARELRALLREVAPALAFDAASALALRPELELRKEALTELAQLPRSEPLEKLLLGMLGAPEPEVREQVLRILGGFADRRFFAPLVQHAQSRGAAALEEAEADALGEALARSGPAEALQQFRGWAGGGKRLLDRLVAPRQRMLLWTAAAGLALLPDAEAGALVKDIAGRADDDLRRRCVRTTVLRRRRGFADG